MEDEGTAEVASLNCSKSDLGMSNAVAESEAPKRMGLSVGQRGRVKNRPVFANSRGLVHVVVTNQNKKNSSHMNK